MGLTGGGVQPPVVMKPSSSLEVHPGGRMRIARIFRGSMAAPRVDPGFLVGRGENGEAKGPERGAVALGGWNEKLVNLASDYSRWELCFQNNLGR